MEFKHLISILEKDQFLSAEKKAELEALHRNTPLSVHMEFRVLLYLGVTLLATGIGFLIYLNIDTIGHTVLISLTGLACAACFYFVYQQALPFAWSEVKNPSPFTDYLLLLACLLFLTFEGYLQFQYNVFGERYGLATVIPAILFLYLAYRFDHKGVLSMAITGFAGWLGISIAPNDFWDSNFQSEVSLLTSISFGIALSSLAYFSKAKDRKRHFFFTYLNFGSHVGMIAVLSGLVLSDLYLLYFLGLAAAVFLLIRYARHEQSNYFFLIAVLYGYVGFSIMYFKLLNSLDTYGDTIVWFGFFYFMISCGAILFFIMNFKKLLSK